MCTGFVGNEVRGAVAACAAAVGFALGAAAGAEEMTFMAVKDNTLYSESMGAGAELSNGAGDSLFSGRTFQNAVRRGLVAFDLSGLALPEDAVLTEAVLTLDITRDPPGASSTPIHLHRLISDWGEGASVAVTPGGTGAPAAAGDASWEFRLFESQAWASAGGDFLEEASATQSAEGLGPINWSGEGLLADINHWRANPAENFGWMLLGDEDTAGSARRFASRENATEALRPRLTLRWIIGGDTMHSGDTDNDLQISLGELLRVIQFFNSNGYHCAADTEDGYAPGPGEPTCTAHSSDYNPQDWSINLSELLRLIQFFNSAGYLPCPEGEDGFCVEANAKEVTEKGAKNREDPGALGGI